MAEETRRPNSTSSDRPSTPHDSPSKPASSNNQPGGSFVQRIVNTASQPASRVEGITETGPSLPAPNIVEAVKGYFFKND